MNLSPTSPFSGKAMSDCDERELDAWCAKLCGWRPQRHESDWVEFSRSPGWEKHGQNILRYGTSWTHAGPLMEREEWPFWWSLDKTPLNEYGWCVVETLPTDERLIGRVISKSAVPTAAIRNAWIIAASHAAQRERGNK